MKTIAIANQKGGVAKTTTAINLGIGLALEGHRVLMCDLDPQADCTKALGFNPEHQAFSVSTIFECKANRKPPPDSHSIILTHDEGVDLIPGHPDLTHTSLAVESAIGREKTLSRYLAQVQDSYDFVIIDCPPTLGILTINALSASDSVIIPLEADYLSVGGLIGMASTIEDTRQEINPALVIDGILITMYTGQGNFTKQMAERIRKDVGIAYPVYKVPVPQTVRIKEASAMGCSIFAHDPRGKAAFAYKAMTNEFLSKQKQRTPEKGSPHLSR